MDELGIAITIEAELARFEKNMQDAGRVVEASTGQMDRATKRAAQGFAQLEGRLDPAARAAARYERDTLKVQRAVERNAVSTDRAAKLQEQLNNQYEQAVARINGVVGAQNSVASNWNNVGMAADGASRRLSAATSSSRNMGFAVQNAGYQIGDFAVQVASGGGVLRPFIQQGTQMISMFGPWGAVLGAAGAVVGALAVSFWDTGEAAEEAGKDAEEALKRITDEARDLKVELGEVANAFEAMILKDAEMRLRLGDSQQAGAQSRLTKATTPEQAFQAQRDLVAAQDMSRQAYFDQVTVLDAIETRRNSSTAAIDAEIERNGQLAAALGVSQREYDVTLKTLELLKTEGFRGTEKEARRLAERLVESAAALDALRNTDKSATKESERAQTQLQRRVAAGTDYVEGLKQEIKLLELSASGRAAEIPLVEAEAKLRDLLARELLPEERDALEALIGTRERLKAAVEAQTEAERQAAEEAKRAAQEIERIWDRAGENIQDALADAFVRGKADMRAFKDFALDMAAEIAAAMIFRPLISPIIDGLQGGGGLGSIAGVGNSASLFGGIGDLAGGAWSWLSGGGNAALDAWTGIGAGASSSSAASLAAWTGGANSMASGGTGALGGLQAGLSAIPVWGWIMAAASTVKGFVEGSDPASLKGGISTLLGPSLEEWQATPRRAAANAMDPLGTMLTDFGLPAFLTIGGIAGKIFGLDKKPSNKFAQTDIDTVAGTISDPVFNPSEYSQGTVDASQQAAQAYLDITKMIAELTGGTGPAAAYIHAGEREPYQVNVGDAGLDFHSAGRRLFQDAESAIDWMVQEFAQGLTGVEDENFRKAIAHGGTGEEILGNVQFVAGLNAMLDDGSMELVNALKAVNEQFDTLTAQARKLGIATADLESLREKEIAATRAQFEAGIAALESEISSTATQYFARTLDPLTQFRDSVLRQGTLSNMSSREQYLYAQSQYRGIDETTSASEAARLGQIYLQQAQAYGASGSIFTDAFREVNQGTDALIALREEEKQDFAALGVVFNTSIADQTGALLEKLDEMIDALERANKARDLAA